MMTYFKITSIVAALVIFCVSCHKAPLPQASPTQPVTPTQVGLAFSIVEQAAPLGDQPVEAVYAVIATFKDWDALTQLVPSSAISDGKAAMQSNQSLYLLAFAGVRGSSGYKLDITGIRPEKGRYMIEVTETIPSQGSIVEPAMTLPYVLAAIPFKELPSDQRLIFVFSDPQGTILGQGETQLP